MTPEPPLWERYRRPRGRVHLTGLQALVRLPLEQIRRDRAAGLRVGGIVSGYPGSPLAGLDRAFEAISALCDEHDLQLRPALNEELAVSAVAGSQLMELFGHSRYDGAIGLWYGKAPGVDRSLDALRHSNFAGTSRHGGVLAVAGDDPACKSSSLPSRSDLAFRHAHIPVLAPADPAEVLELGLHGFALSRSSGLWVGLKIVADVADGGAIVELPRSRPLPVLPKLEYEGEPFEHRVDARLLPPQVQHIETRLLLARLEVARRYAYVNGLDRILESRPRDRIGVVAVGRLARELSSAFETLGLDARAREACGLRLYHLRLLHPLDERRLLEFASGLEEIVVLDDRPGAAEDAIRTLLCNAIDPPRVLGQRGPGGEPWIARHWDLDASTISTLLGPYLATLLGRPQLADIAEKLRGATRLDPVPGLRRLPQFCSGCPHSTSTRLPEGAVAGGGIGCHTMALWMDRGVRYVGAMGSEGAHWIGLAPFVDTPHLFQNLGDGTYFHSGRQALRAAVAAGVSITYKLLHNGSVAMTGGQSAVGARPVAGLVRDLLADGVRRVVAVTDDPDLRALAAERADVECIDRSLYDDAMCRLAREPGVTVLLYDALCANQKQKQERRGLRAEPLERIAIHRDVCEGCGDCGRRSRCASLFPVATPLGRKTRVHDASCSDDRTCLEGDCPAFVALAGVPKPVAPDEALLRDLPAPPPCSWDGERFEIGLVGVGSTGVVTLDAILVRAAELDGLWALHLDQTGLAQRGGQVRSHC
ncbi:MAG: indolepyruvate ferredoxin oxidoreductase family protein, partial [Myxococcota bacterium]